jgi:plastocyanin
MHSTIAHRTAFCLALSLIACGGERKAESDTTAAPAAASTTAATANALSATPLTPESGRKVIAVELNTDETGKNQFTPDKVEAHAGDVIRFTLKTGVHNVDFLPDSNAGKSGLPAPSDMLQLPGQSVDLAVHLAPGTYYFQCDPHALLGMKGHLVVE